MYKEDEMDRTIESALIVVGAGAVELTRVIVKFLRVSVGVLKDTRRLIYSEYFR